MKQVRQELEKAYAQRIDDNQVDIPENAKYKEACMVALRNAEASFTNYAGSIRSIKGVVVTCL